MTDDAIAKLQSSKAIASSLKNFLTVHMFRQDRDSISNHVFAKSNDTNIYLKIHDLLVNKNLASPKSDQIRRNNRL